MDGNAWYLREIDPETRRRADEEAALRGLSLGDYLTEILLAGARANGDSAVAPEEPAGPAPPVVAGPDAAGLADPGARRRLDLLQRRVGSTVGRLGATVGALGGAVDDLAARVAETETLTLDTAEKLNAAVQDIRSAIDGLARRCDAAETQAETQDSAVKHTAADLARRLSAVEEAAHSHTTSVAILADAHETLKRAVASDFSEFASDTAERLDAELDQLRKASEDAARQAEAAVAHFARELGVVRHTLEQQLSHSAASALAQDHLDRRLATVEQAAQASAASVATLAGAQEALKRAVADDFAEFSAETTQRLGAGLDELRAAAGAAARQADEAVSHLVRELGAVRQAVEHRLAEGAAAAHEQMNAAFADFHARLDALATRAAAHEAALTGNSSALHDRISETERGLQDGLLELSAALRKADAALTAETARIAVDTGAAIQELKSAVRALQRDQEGGAAQQEMFEISLGRALDDISTLRESLEHRISVTGEQARRDLSSAWSDWDARAEAIMTALRNAESAAAQAVSGLTAESRAALALVHRRIDTVIDDQQGAVARVLENVQRDLGDTNSSWDARFDALTARLTNAERDGAQLRQIAAAEAERIEACTLAALDKLRSDIVAAQAAAEAKAGEALERTTAIADDAKSRETAFLARFNQLDDAFAAAAERFEALEADADEARSLTRRLQALEDAATRAETEQALALIRAQISALAEEQESQREAHRPLTERVEGLERAVRDGQQRQDLANMHERIAALAAEQGTLRQAQQPIVDRLIRLEGAVEIGHLEAALATLREQVSALASDQAEAQRQQAPLTERLHRLEEMASQQHYEQSIGALKQEIAALSDANARTAQSQAPLVECIEQLRLRLEQAEDIAQSAAGRAQDVATALSRHITNSGDADALAQARLDAVESELAAPRKGAETPLGDVELRLQQLEERQTSGLDGLREQIRQFVAANEQRLESLETANAADADVLAYRLERLEQLDLPSEFEALRRKVEERILGLEERSIRALEQVGESISMLERRLLDADSEPSSKAG